jgi:anaphase-promoting complex subunit 2
MQLSELSDKLVKGVERRLLIPGVLTQNVLNQYINMLKVLQILDPHGFIFDSVTLPIKNYLLKRNDTLRCIISFLTEDV